MEKNERVEIEIREEWEGDDPRYCIEPLQPKRVIGDEEMVLVVYEEVAA